MVLVVDQLRQVVRRLARAPLFTGVTLFTLAVAIGANTAIFSIVNGILLRPLPYPHPEQLIGVWHRAPGLGLKTLNMAPYLYFVYREHNTTLQDIGVYDGDSLNVTGIGEPEHVTGLDVTDGTLPLLGVQPVAGRLFTRGDDKAGAPATVILSWDYWQRRFGGNPFAVGRSITVDGTSRQIIGVLPRGFHVLDRRDDSLYLPMQWDRGKTHLGSFSYEGLARLKPGVNIQQANADLGRLLPVALRSFPAPDGYSVSLFEKARIQSELHPLRQDVVGDIGSILWLLMGSILMVLLVACANVANLLLVRVEGRRQELAIRSALGATRQRITVDLLAESTLLGFFGALLGLGLAWGALRVLVSVAPAGLPRLHDVGLDLPVLLFTAGLALLTSLLIGLLPAARYAGGRSISGLREGGRGLSQGRERHRARKTLVVVQISLALVLLICSGLMIRTFRALSHVQPGFTSPSTLQTFHIFIPDAQIPDSQGDRLIRTYQEIRDRLASVPGVTAVSFGAAVPMDGSSNNNPVYVQGHVYAEGELPPIRRFKYAAPGFLATLGTPLLTGRSFTWTETFDRRPVAVVSESFARQYWRTPQEAIGQRIRVAGTDDWREIIGVAADVHDDGVSQPAPISVYWPLLRKNFNGQKDNVARGVSFVLRTPRAGSQLFMEEVQRAVWSVMPEIPLANATTLGELYDKSMSRTTFTLVLLSLAGGMALLLGVVGIYGVISYSIAQRTREIGIRMALGSTRGGVTALFLRQGMILAAAGAVCGLLVACFAMRLMSSMLFHVSPNDPMTYLAMTSIVAVTAGIACYLPARRAATIEPVNALRSE